MMLLDNGLEGVYNRHFGPWRSLASALAWGARGPEFKSRRPDQIPQRLTTETVIADGVLESNWSPKWAPAERPPEYAKTLLEFLAPLSSYKKPDKPDISILNY